MILTTGGQAKIDGHTFTFATDTDGWPIEPCPRCQGTGRYAHDGYTDRCYLCGGHRTWTRKDHGQATPEAAQAEHGKVLARRAKDAARRDAKREQARIERLAQMWAAREQLAGHFNDYPLAVDATYYPNLEAAGAPDRVLRGYGFLADRWEQGRTLTPRMLEICSEHTARLIDAANRAATTEPLTAGRRELSGTVAKVTWRENDYGTTRKLLVVLTTGQRVWGTCPRSIDLDDEALEGSAITLTATVEPSDDPTFGFYTRPTKAHAEPATV